MLLLTGCGADYLPEIEGMVAVPAGWFIMGNDDGDLDEVPAHRVYLDSYYIGQYEVTNAEYRGFVEGTGYRSPTCWDKEAYNNPKAPVLGVSWIDAVKYCEWLSQKKGAAFRLPTEAEWEKAARGKDGWSYPWGDFWDPSRCVSAASAEGYLRKPQPVGQIEAGKSPCGAYDMAGNAWEWCSDWYDPGYYKYSSGKNPQGAVTGIEKVARGGCWNDTSRYCRTTDRWPTAMTFSDIYVGFRVCRSAKDSSLPAMTPAR